MGARVVHTTCCIWNGQIGAMGSRGCFFGVKHAFLGVGCVISLLPAGAGCWIREKQLPEIQGPARTCPGTTLSRRWDRGGGSILKSGVLVRFALPFVKKITNTSRRLIVVGFARFC